MPIWEQPEQQKAITDLLKGFLQPVSEALEPNPQGFPPREQIKSLVRMFIPDPENPLTYLTPMQIGPVYHGSPYKFSKFENKYIGSGEGAQSFGWGHYLSESPTVAKTYSDTLSSIKVGKINITPDSWWYKPLRRIVDNEEGWTVKNLKQSILDARNSVTKKTRQEGDALLKELYDGSIPKSEGNIYEATLHKGKTGERYLEWDKSIKPSDPLWLTIRDGINKLDSKVKDVVNSDLRNYRGSIRELYGRIEMTGEDIYNSLSRSFGSREKVSKFLGDLGISGIKYPTGTLSGVKGSNTYNYVVFNPEDITIDKIMNIKGTE